MIALFKEGVGAGQMRLRETGIPEIAEDEALVRVSCCGICGTDLKIQDGDFACDPPVIVGHEFSGVVERCGARVKHIGIGARVVAEQHFRACGVCPQCLSGNRQWCPEKRSPGYLSDGAFAEYIAVKENLLHVIPEGVTMEQAALIEPMGIVAFGVLERLKIYPGETVVILGCGPIALLALQLVAAAGASRVYVTGLDVDAKKRFAIAKRFGATQSVNVQHENLTDFVREATDGRLADAVIDLSGAKSAILSGLSCLRKGGRFGAIGMAHGEIPLDWSALVLRAISVVFSYSSDYTSWKRCLDMIASGQVKLDEFTRDVFPLADWEAAFARARSGEALKVILRP